MQVSVEAGEGLLRKMSVEVPTETVEAEVENRLQSLKGRVKIDGFRPGKVPMKLIKQRYGDQILYEVAGEVMQKSFQDAVMQENLRLAGNPVIKNEVIKPGEPITFTAEFEVFPDLEIAPVGDLKIEKVKCEIADNNVDEMLETLQKQQTGWEESDAAAADGDRVTINFVGKIDGEAFEGGTADDVPLVLGSGSMIEGFEDNLLGKSKGEETTFEVTFPEDYAAAHLAGKASEFTVTVNMVESPVVPELDDDFAKRYGVEEGGIDKLREDVRNNLQRELDSRIFGMMKSNVLDQLVEANDIVVPDGVVEEEVNQLKSSADQGGAPVGDDESVRADAFKRVKLGLILGELVKQAEIQPTREMVTERIQKMAQDYEDPQALINHYQSNPEMLRSIESLVLEDMMVEWIAEQATVTDIDKNFDEIMQTGRMA